MPKREQITAGPAVDAGQSGGGQGQIQTQMSFDSVNDGAAFMGTCPDCGSQLEYAEGCVKCHVCGFSECG